MNEIKKYIPYILGFLAFIFVLPKIRDFFSSMAVGSAYGSQSVGATLTSSQAVLLANKLNSSWGYFSDDEDMVYSVFQQMNNLADLNLVGSKFYAIDGETLDDLVKWLNQALYSNDDGTRDRINEILSSKNIDYQF